METEAEKREREVNDVNLNDEVFYEMQRQVQKWGVQTHTPLTWYAILGEEVGEVGKAILETWYQNLNLSDPASYRKELIQVAAVALSAVRAIDRGHVP